MNESVRKDLKDRCTAAEFDIIETIIQTIENTPSKKQKDAIKKIIDEEIE